MSERGFFSSATNSSRRLFVGMFLYNFPYVTLNAITSNLNAFLIVVACCFSLSFFLFLRICGMNNTHTSTSPPAKRDDKGSEQESMLFNVISLFVIK